MFFFTKEHRVANQGSLGLHLARQEIFVSRVHKPCKPSGSPWLEGLLIRAGQFFPLLDEDDPGAKLTLKLKTLRLTEGGESAVGRS